MDRDRERRFLYRQGLLFLLAAAVLGIVVAAQAPHPAKWMAAHVTTLLAGLLIIGFGALWPQVALERGQRRAAITMGLLASWGGVLANIYSAIVNLPGPATEPGRNPDAAWQLIPFFGLLILVVPSTFGSFFLVWRGLRGETGPTRS